jgi:tetratricopeptide (TPR) repeat protein
MSVGGNMMSQSGSEEKLEQFRKLRDLFWDKVNAFATQEAFKIVYEALTLSREGPFGHEQLHFQGLEAFVGQEYDRSLTALRSSHELAPDNVEIVEDLAAVLGELGRHRERYELLSSVAPELYTSQKRERTERFLTRLATAAIDLELYEDAERYFSDLERLNPQSNLLINNRLGLYWHYYLLCRESDEQGRKRYLRLMEESLDALKVVNPSWQTDPSFLNNLGVVQYLKGEYQKSVETLRKAIDLYAHYGLAWFNLGLSEYRLRNYDESQRAFSRSIEEFRREKNYPSAKLSELWLSFSGLQSGSLPIPREKLEHEKDLANFMAHIINEHDCAENFITRRHFAEMENLEYVVRKRTLTKEQSSLTILRGFCGGFLRLPQGTDKFQKFGGGYFLNFGGHGIVIDPGFNFLVNFYRQGFSILDIDAVIITNSFADHTSDLEPLFMLLNHLNTLISIKSTSPEKIPAGIEERLPTNPTRIQLFLSQDALSKFVAWLSFFAQKCIQDVIIMVPNEALYLFDDLVKVTPVRSMLRGEAKFTFPLGLLFDLKSEGNETVRIGYTSDTMWYEGMGTRYEGCRVIVGHLGPIVEEEFPLGFSQDHLGICGSYRLIEEARPSIFILSDFGDELEIRRAKIVDSFNDKFWQDGKKTSGTKCISSDIGLSVALKTLGIGLPGRRDLIKYSVISESYSCDKHRYSYLPASSAPVSKKESG